MTSGVTKVALRSILDLARALRRGEVETLTVERQRGYEQRLATDLDFPETVFTGRDQVAVTYAVHRGR